jgi:hypothetical protein
MKRTIYIGAASSGKSYAAKLQVAKTNYGRYTIINGRELRFTKKNDVDYHIMQLMNRGGQLEKILVIDDVPRAVLKDVLHYFCGDEYEINPKGKSPYIFKPEEVILIADSDTLLSEVSLLPSMLRRYQIFQCHSANAHGVMMEIINTSPVSNPNPTHN